MRAMRSLVRLFLSLLVSLSLGMGAVVHAGEEAAESSIADCTVSFVHDKDDESRDRDVDQSGLHAHGGCHGHHQADALGRGHVVHAPAIRALNFAGGDDFLPQLVPDANLRPPIA